MSMDHIPLVGFLFSLKRLLPLSSSVLAYCSNFCPFGVHSVATLPKHSWWILPWWKPWWRTVQMCVMKHLKAHSRHSKYGWYDNAQDGSLFFFINRVSATGLQNLLWNGIWKEIQSTVKAWPMVSFSWSLNQRRIWRASYPSLPKEILKNRLYSSPVFYRRGMRNKYRQQIFKRFFFIF